MKAFATERRLSFWPLQLAGWAIYSLASMAALLPSRHARDYVAFRTMYLIAGFIGSFPLYGFCHWLRQLRVPLIRAMFLCALVGYLVGIPGAIAIVWAEIHFGGATGGIRWATVLSNAVGVAFMYVTWSAFYFGIKHYQDVEEQKIRLQESEALARDAQLRALRYQLQPHFLFNTLNAISTLVLTDRPKPATQMIAKLGALLRMTLDSPETHEVTLDAELATTEEYLQIEQLRFGAGLRVSYMIDQAARQILVPRFLLQPLVENAVRHGISKMHNGGEIVVRAAVNSGTLRVVVENGIPDRNDSSGQSRPDDRVHGLGLNNARLRLAQLYGQKASLEAGPATPSLFRTVVTLPVNVRTPNENAGGRFS